MKKTITVFGSSMPREGEGQYEFGRTVGGLLAKGGFNVCTGGYEGIMDAVSRGANENGGEAIGVMVDFWNSVPSPYLTKKIECTSLFERIQTLVELGDAYLVLQGGTGTLLELAVVWEFMNKNLLSVKPIACHSNIWKGITDLMERQIVKERRVTGLVKYFEKEDEIVEYFRNVLNHK